MHTKIQTARNTIAKSFGFKSFGKKEALLMLAGGALAMAFLSDAQLPLWPQGWGKAPGVDSAILLVALAIGIIPITRHWWLGLDEAAQEAHKWAWWWGGNLGFIAGGIGFALFALSGTQLLSQLSPNALIGTGFAAAMVAQSAGYGIAWLWWWQSRR